MHGGGDRTSTRAAKQPLQFFAETSPRHSRMGSAVFAIAFGFVIGGPGIHKVVLYEV